MSFLSGFRTWAEKCLGHTSQTHAGLTFHTNYLLSSLHTTHPCQPHILNMQKINKKKLKKSTWGWKGKCPTQQASLNFPWKKGRRGNWLPLRYFTKEPGQAVETSLSKNLPESQRRGRSWPPPQLWFVVTEPVSIQRAPRLSVCRSVQTQPAYSVPVERPTSIRVTEEWRKEKRKGRLL